MVNGVAVCSVVKSAAGAGVNSGFVSCPPSRRSSLNSTSAKAHQFRITSSYCSAISRYVSSIPKVITGPNETECGGILDLCDSKSTISRAVFYGV